MTPARARVEANRFFHDAAAALRPPPGVALPPRAPPAAAPAPATAAAKAAAAAAATRQAGRGGGQRSDMSAQAARRELASYFGGLEARAQVRSGLVGA